MGRASRWDSKAGLTISFTNDDSETGNDVNRIKDLVSAILEDSQQNRVTVRVRKELTLTEKQEQVESDLA